MNNKVKLLLLGGTDIKLSGHAYSHYRNLSDDLFEKKLVVIDPTTEDTTYSINKYISKKDIIRRLGRKINFLFFQKFTRLIKVFFKFGIIYYSEDSKHPEYCYYDFECDEIPVYKIIRKIGNFTPDFIIIYWIRNSITSNIIKLLANYYNAKIVFVLVDQQHLTGGCHYPVKCREFINSCENCPALKVGKELSSKQLNYKYNNLKDLVKIVVGTPGDNRLARESRLLGNSKLFIDSIAKPKVKFTPKNEARSYYGLDNNRFVILWGANSIKEIRKGIKYGIEALVEFSKYHDNITLLCLGHLDIDFDFPINLQVVKPGFVTKEELFKAYCASDCYLSTTIADSGPMMVNFAVALGVPVVTFKIGVAEDLVEDRITGYFARYKDSYDLALGLDFIYNLSEEQYNFAHSRSLEIINEIDKDHWSITLYNSFRNGDFNS